MTRMEIEIGDVPGRHHALEITVGTYDVDKPSNILYLTGVFGVQPSLSTKTRDDFFIYILYN